MLYTKSKFQSFKKTVLGFYRKSGRHDLPWRKTRDPYRILVSEVMLQQTQVERVIPFYRAFLKKFPTARALSRAPLSDVLKAWQGLGYNRRAKMLREAAKVITDAYGGKFPKEKEELLKLPGIGPYTASAVRVFAFNFPEIMIETNIRAAYLHHFFPKKERVRDAEVLSYIVAVEDRKNPREWYWALMDYGSHLKKTIPNPSRKSAHHARQKPFKGSDREIRGAILKELAKGGRTPARLAALGFDRARLAAQLKALLGEGMIARKRGTYLLAD
jgi:A/G-specific adenine glycosylase